MTMQSEVLQSISFDMVTDIEILVRLKNASCLNHFNYGNDFHLHDFQCHKISTTGYSMSNACKVDILTAYVKSHRHEFDMFRYWQDALTYSIV